MSEAWRLEEQGCREGWGTACRSAEPLARGAVALNDGAWHCVCVPAPLPSLHVGLVFGGLSFLSLYTTVLRGLEHWVASCQKSR